jgi:hypothetical protein
VDGGDTLPEDDRFLFAVERADPRPMLFVRRNSGSRDLLYFQAALEATPNAAFRLQAAGQRETGNIDPSRFSVIVLSDPGRLPDEFENRLRQYVRTGGSVLIAAGPATARLSEIPVAGVPVTGSVYAGRGEARFWNVGYSDYSHPAVGIQDLWEGVKFYQAVQVEPGDNAVVVRLADETPLLLECPAGEGRTLLFTSTFDNVSNDLPLHPAFVAFAERTTSYLGRLGDRTSSYAVGAFVDLRASDTQAQAVEVIDPSGERALSLEESATAANFRLAETGYYEFRRSTNRSEMIAANAERRESDLGVIASDTVKLWEGAPELATGATAGEMERRPWKLWWYVLLAAFVIMLVESAVAARYLGIDRGAA